MYDTSDPRSRLASTSGPSATAYAAADYVRFYTEFPVETDRFARTWWARGQNFYLAYTEAQEGAEFERADQVDEHVIILPGKDSGIRVKAGATNTEVDGYSLVIVPPGPSTVTVVKSGRVIRLFSVRNGDLAGLPLNKESYISPHPNVRAFEPWPDPPNGFKTRVYSLDVPKEPGRFGRIWRCTTFMVNFLDPSEGPRDPSKMSPHSHDDFEQCSLALEGEYVHHLRWPWIPDMTQWRPDDHGKCGSPSVTIIPPPTIHTSQAVGDGTNQLVDIFCPPRDDFSKQPGWVLNANEYPMP